MQRIHGVVQHYSWGDPHVIPALLGHGPDGRPWAELWFGTHERGPSRLEDGRPLEDLSGPLPYLVKLLAAAAPLSLQTHPDAARARAGFADGYYGDPHPKPELIRALTEFEALCGIRPIDETLELLEQLQAHTLAAAVRSEGVEGALDALLRRRLPADPIVAACATDQRPEAAWVWRLHQQYPDDPGVAVTLLLNYVRLQPGQALALDAGNLHAYLRGTGIEVMGNSDNVVRAGLTHKPVDIDELLAVVDLTEVRHPMLDVHEPHLVPQLGRRLCTVPARMAHRSTGQEIAVDAHGGGWYLEPGSVSSWPCEAYVVTT